MSVPQKITLVITGTSGTQGLSSINRDLREGWRFVSATPMGGAGTGESARFAALVVLERSEQETGQLLAEMEEQAEADIEGQIEQALEGGYVVGTPSDEGTWKNPDLE